MEKISTLLKFNVGIPFLFFFLGANMMNIRAQGIEGNHPSVESITHTSQATSDPDKTIALAVNSLGAGSVPPTGITNKENNKGSLSGTVVDEDGQPIIGASQQLEQIITQKYTPIISWICSHGSKNGGRDTLCYLGEMESLRKINFLHA